MMKSILVFNLGAELAVLITLIIIALSLISEKSIRKKSDELTSSKYVLAHIIVLIASIDCAIVRDCCFGTAEYDRIVVTMECCCYVLQMIAAFFLSMYIISDLQRSVYVNSSTSYVLAFSGGCACILMIVGFLQDTNWYMTYSANTGFLFRTSFAVMEFLPSGMLFFDFFLILSCGKLIPKERLYSWGYITITPVAAGVLKVMVPKFPSEALAAFGGILLYVSVYINNARQIELSQKELTESKVSLMVSQIQPHFIYNSLNTIYFLIEQDTELAQEAVSRFSDYLRQNINSLKDDRPVSFSEELSHLDAYLYLELMRFGDELKIEKNITVSDFYVPPLSVQPLVENAIKHGVSKKEGGGSVKISAYETDDSYVIEILDDGVGFEAGKIKDDSGTHIGLFNVNSRLKTMCSGSLSVTSKIDVGTKCVITLPKSGQPAPRSK